MSTTDISHEYVDARNTNEVINNNDYSTLEESWRSKHNRNVRQRKRNERKNLLHSMTEEERSVFLEHESMNKIESVEKFHRALQPTSHNLRIAIDLQFDEIMNDKERRSLAKQLKYSYGAVRQMEDPFVLNFLNCSPELHECLTVYNANRWHVDWQDCTNIQELVSNNIEKIIYLSPDSPFELTSLSPSTMYVIGGIVDKTRKKGATLEAANKAGIQTAQLPIKKYIHERLDHILNVNTVINILIHFYVNHDWKSALRDCLPQRKQQSAGRKARRRESGRNGQVEEI